MSVGAIASEPAAPRPGVDPRPLVFVIVGAPVTKKNSQQRTRHGIIQSKAYRTWEPRAVRQLREQRGLPPTAIPMRVAPEAGLLNMRALVYRKAAVGDLLNYLAAASDALQKACVLIDDKQIVQVDGSRLLIDRKNPRIEIELTRLGPAGAEQADLFDASAAG